MFISARRVPDSGTPSYSTTLGYRAPASRAYSGRGTRRKPGRVLAAAHIRIIFIHLPRFSQHPSHEKRRRRSAWLLVGGWRHVLIRPRTSCFWSADRRRPAQGAGRLGARRPRSPRMVKFGDLLSKTSAQSHWSRRQGHRGVEVIRAELFNVKRPQRALSYSVVVCHATIPSNYLKNISCSESFENATRTSPLCIRALTFRVWDGGHFCAVCWY